MLFCRSIPNPRQLANGEHRVNRRSDYPIALDLPSLPQEKEPDDRGNQRNRRDSNENPLESVIKSSRHRELGIGEVPMRIRASQHYQAREGEGGRNGQCEQDPTSQPPPRLPPAGKLKIDDLELLGNRAKAIRLRLRDALAEQRPYGGAERLGYRDEHIGVGNREAALPFGDGLPDDVQFDRQLFLGEATRFADRSDVLAQHCGLLPSIGLIIGRSGPLRQATGSNIGRKGAWFSSPLFDYQTQYHYIRV